MGEMSARAGQAAIWLNVYALGGGAVGAALLGALAAMGAGLYHSGVEIDGWEYSFSSSGICRTRPQLESFGTLKEHICVGTFPGSMNEIKRCIHDLGKGSFMSGSYDLTTCNCNHFSDALLFKLLGEHLPPWVNRAANFGSYVLPRSMDSPSATQGDLCVPGEVMPPIQPARTGESVVSNGSGAGNGWGLFASVFRFFGDKSAPPTTEPATTGPAPRQKKELTNRQREALAKLQKEVK